MLIAAAAFWGWTNRAQFVPLTPLYQKPYIILYGRYDCGFCQAMRAGLRGKGIPYVWKHIDDPEVRKELVPRMEYAHVDPNTLLPVVDVNAELLGYPTLDEVTARYRRR